MNPTTQPNPAPDQTTPPREEQTPEVLERMSFSQLLYYILFNPALQQT